MSNEHNDARTLGSYTLRRKQFAFIDFLWRLVVNHFRFTERGATLLALMMEPTTLVGNFFWYSDLELCVYVCIDEQQYNFFKL